MAEFTERCPSCEAEIGGSNAGTAWSNLQNHIRTKHPELVDDELFSTDEPPQPRKATGAKKQAPKRTAVPKGMPSLQAQLEMPYKLLGAVCTSRGLFATGGILEQQAGPCAAAWDEFLKRYPKLREKIEQGMVAADIVNLVMVHVPIVQVARAEILARQEAMSHYEGGIPTPAAA